MEMKQTLNAQSDSGVGESTVALSGPQTTLQGLGRRDK